MSAGDVEDENQQSYHSGRSMNNRKQTKTCSDNHQHKQNASSANLETEMATKLGSKSVNHQATGENTAAEPSQEISFERKQFYRQISQQWIRAADDFSDDNSASGMGGRASATDISVSSDQLVSLSPAAESTGDLNNSTADNRRWDLIPKFEAKEIILGAFLGNGAYGIVYEVVGFTNLVKRENQKARLKIKQNHLNVDDEAKYALKKIRGKLSPAQRNDAIADLAIEAKVLSCITHRNIVKMYATARDDPLSSSFFIVMEKLRGTLEDRLVDWSAGVTQAGGRCFCFGGGNNEIMSDIWSERFGVMCDLASAIRYLHKHNIVYRDIKPENMGFDIQGNLKLFDFGLAKPLHDEKTNEFGLYKLTSNAGSRRYMAPEVAMGKPYNLTVDVYSFAILFWQVCALETPFADLTGLDTHLEEVVKGGRRPVIHKKWPTSWGLLLRKCWNDDISTRPGLEEVQEFLVHEQDIMDFAKIGKVGYSNKSHASLELQISNRKLSESCILDNSSSQHSRTSQGYLDVDSRFTTSLAT